MGPQIRSRSARTAPEATAAAPTAAEAQAAEEQAAEAATEAAFAEHIVALGGPRALDPRLLGGKGARLDDMIRAGLPVPPAFCLTTGLFDLFLRHTGLAADLAAAGPEKGTGDSTEKGTKKNPEQSSEDSSEQGRSMRERVLAHEIPEPIARAVLAAYEELGRPRVAVRSSAVREDSADRSFAGQHDTLLDIAGDEALLDAVRACWASLWSDRAAAYREEAAPVGSIAVVVQRMVHADAAGVLFTVDPITGAPGRQVVEACWGLGEGLVSGRVTADSFVVDETGPEVVEERVRYKVTKCVPVEPGRVGLVKVDPALRDVPCLTRDQLGQLTKLALDVRAHYGGEQDIEWALRDGEFSLLQTRPVTTAPARATAPRGPYVCEQPEAVRRGTLWSRMDIGEIFTGMMTPLGLSFARYYQRHVHPDCARALGVRDTGDPDLHMGFFQGHVYLNISYSAYLLGQCLPTRDQRHFTRRFVSEEVDTAAYTNPFGRWPGGLADLRSTLFWLRHTARETRTMKSRAAAMVASRSYEFDRARRIDVRRMSRRELRAELRRHLDYFHDAHVGYMPYYINAFGFYSVLTELCGAWLGEKGTNLQNRVKTDMSSLRTVASAREIWNLAQAAKARPAVMRIIRENPLEDIEPRLRADAEGAAFWRSHMEPFLRANGTRGRQEMELTHPRWVDDPSYVFQMIRRYAADGFAIDEILGRDRARQDADARRVLAELPRVKRRVLETVISLYSLCSELRETTRMSMITSIWLVRTVVYEVGRRLVEEGVLRSLDEVAYLDFEDVRRYLASDVPAREAFPRAALDEARRTHRYLGRLPEPPLTFIGEHDPARALPRAADGARIEGLGASPGRVVGRARVIEDLVWQADEFQVGEILVTRFTDASWTPLFAIAGGVVTDIGSMLSHSSIVSREFGVPSVVNTKCATSRIATGDLIAVDGDTGAVDIVASHRDGPTGQESDTA
ncbi:PEP/pyruvate-binding domain-containing protein [Streptomyces sp. URMC 123]|uniref:PEP/pyruvate-binding domain-containing protein n=1 Tax=Streptomyces sp. URMC 123 TaxID=3423403 RepID=UPI003F1C18EC